MVCGICLPDVQVNKFVFLLVVLFSISSWIDINGLWVELPILVQNLPEKWNLPSYMSVIIQIANIGPLIFTISLHIWPRKVKEIPVIYVIILVGAVSCLLLGFFWDAKTVIAGVLHSTALLTLQFFLALVDCTTSVAFYTYMAFLKPQYMTALFIGESLSGLLPSLVALGQGAGQITCVNQTTWTNVTINRTIIDQVSDSILYPQYQQPKFSIEIFFFFLFAMMLLSLLAFTLLNYLPYCKKEFLSENDSVGTSSDLNVENYDPVLLTYETANSYELNDNNAQAAVINAADDVNSQSQLLTKRKSTTIIQDSGEERVKFNVEKGRPVKLCTFKFLILAILTIWINALTNGVLPSIQSYSCLPYGNLTYHLAVKLSNMAAPLACFALFFVKVRSMIKWMLLTILGTGFAAYSLTTAVMSPTPLFIDKPAGTPLIICAWVFQSFILTYAKVSVAAEFRVGGKKALLWCGVFTQVGSAIGAFVMFILINQLHYFNTANPCR